MRTRRLSMARWMTVGLAALWLTTQLSGFAHLAFVPHVTCAEHGELVDAGLAAVASPQAVERDTVAAQEVAFAEHAHDHCLLTALRRDPALLHRSSVEVVARLSASSLSGTPHGEPVPPAIAVLDVAPKSSPPSA